MIVLVYNTDILARKYTQGQVCILVATYDSPFAVCCDLQVPTLHLSRLALACLSTYLEFGRIQQSVLVTAWDEPACFSRRWRGHTCGSTSIRSAYIHLIGAAYDFCYGWDTNKA